MAFLRLVEGVTLDFSPTDSMLINKNKEKFIASSKIYEDYDFVELIERFFTQGNKRFKTKNAKLDFLACYQAILNHKELMPTEDKIQRVVDYRLGIVPEEDEQMQNGISQMIEEMVEEFGEPQGRSAIDEIQEMDEEQNSQTEGILRGMDMQIKWSRILFRVEEINEFVENLVNERIEMYAQGDCGDYQMPKNSKTKINKENSFMFG